MIHLICGKEKDIFLCNKPMKSCSIKSKTRNVDPRLFCSFAFNFYQKEKKIKKHKEN